MKRIFFLLVISLSLLSCSKESVKGTDDADAFVGIYSVSVVNNVVWGSASGTTNDTGRISITKISETKVQVDGYFRTTGEIVGSFVYFESMSSSDSAGYMTTTFNQGVLNGNVLTFTANQTGQLASNGVLYPYRCSSSFTAIKQ